MKRIFLSNLFIAALLAPICFAEFQANTHTTWNQKNAAVAIDGQGNFVVVWYSYRQDDDSGGIFGQRFDPNGIPIDDEFQINTETSGNQAEPSVAMNTAGDFIVAWQSPGIDEEDIFIQRFDPNGQKVGDEFLVNTYTQGQQLCPKVVMNSDGAFAVVWEGDKPESKITIISCQLFDANGLAFSEEFNVNTPAACRYPDIAMAPNGNFTIVWLQGGNQKYSIWAQMYTADCTAEIEPFEASTINFSSVTRPSIAMDVNGYFVVTWDGDPVKAGLDDIHARLFDPNGTPFGEQFIVNTSLAEAQCYPQVAMNNKGEFVIVWESEIESQTTERDISGQRFDSFGQPIGDEFLINTYVEGDQRYPDIALNDKGDFVTVWQSDGQDDSRFGIFGEINSIEDFIEVTDMQEYSQ
jgi:hypothetical protein